MSLSDTVHEIAVVVGGVTGIAGGAGKVHEFLPYTASEAEFKAQFVAGGTLHAWAVTREGTEARDQSARVIRELHRIAIYGWRAVKTQANDPSSEATMQNLAEAVRDALHGVVSATEGKRYLPNGRGFLLGPVQVAEFGPSLFGNGQIEVLAWRAKLTLVIEDRSTY